VALQIWALLRFAQAGNGRDSHANTQDAAAITDRAAAQTDRTGNQWLKPEYEGHNRDLARLVIEEFKKPYILAIYIVGLLLLGMHLNHGVSSAIQSMGVSGYGPHVAHHRAPVYLHHHRRVHLDSVVCLFLFQDTCGDVSSTQGTAIASQDTTYAGQRCTNTMKLDSKVPSGPSPTSGTSTSLKSSW
jgi:hypothetical protein